MQTAEPLLLPWKTRLGWFLLTALICIAVYSPTTGVVSRQDNDAWFIDTVRVRELVPLVTQFYSYNRVRKMAPGDTMVFRPLVFFDLAVLTWAFGPENPKYWQIAGLAIHLLTCFILMLLLTTLWPSTAACLCALLFSVLAAGKFMVHYCHINAFMLALATVLFSIYLALRYQREHRRGTMAVVLMVLCLTLATFTLEIFAPFGIFIFFYLWLTLAWEFKSLKSHLNMLKENRVLFLLFLPPLVYAACDVCDLYYRTPYIQSLKAGGFLDSPTQLVFAYDPGRTASYFIALCAFWLLQGVLLLPEFWLGIWLCTEPAALTSIGTLILAGAGLIAFRRIRPITPLSLPPLLFEYSFEILMSGMIFFILIIYVVFRINMRGLTYSLYMPIYPYVFWSFVLIVACSRMGRHPGFKMGARKQRMACALIALLALGNAVRTYTDMTGIAEKSRGDRTFIAETAAFIQAHRDENGFSINRPHIQYLFFKYSTNKAPKYTLERLPGGHIAVTRNW